MSPTSDRPNPRMNDMMQKHKEIIKAVLLEAI